MDAERWARIQSIFHETVDRPRADQIAFVEAACGDDAELASTVRAMLDEDGQEQSFLDRQIGVAAGAILAGADGTPRRIGRYRILRRIGEGGMGVVYLAEREDVGGLVAIKVLRDAWVSPARRERFASERRLLASLTHPAIASLYDADALPDGTPWFAMEYVEGLTLGEYCTRNAPSLAARLQLFRQICEAVQHAHQQLIVHRDLKPTNILVTGAGAIKLLDFGIAKQLQPGDDPGQRERTELRHLTPDYAAPEQLRGDQVGVHTDVYALGVVLYFLLSGRAPFDLSDTTPQQAEALVLAGPLHKPSVANAKAGAGALKLGRAAWSDLDVLCLSAMHPDPRRRYASVERLLRDVDHYLHGRPLESRPDSRRYRAGKFVRRHWRELTAAGVLLLVSSGLVLFYTVRLASARDAAVREAARTHRLMQFVLTLFEGGEQDAAPGNELKVVTMVEEGVRQAKGLAADPAIQAELYVTLGNVLERLGRFDQANPLLESALAERRAHLAPSHPDVADALIALGSLRLSQARYDDADRLVREAVQQTRAALPAGHPTAVRAEVVLGKVLVAKGDYKSAIPLLEAAVREYSTGSSTNRELGPALSELANSHFYVGHLDEADALNRRVIEIDRRTYGDRHPNVADDLINLAAVLSSRGRYGEAVTMDREAFAILDAWYGRDHPETASAMTILAQALAAENKLDEAADLLRGALAIQERAYGEVHPRVAFVLNELAVVDQRRKALDDAERAFRRTLAIYRTIYPDGRHQRVGVALSNLASVQFDRGQYVEAERLLRQAVDLYATILPPDHLNVVIAHLKLGRVLIRLRRYREGESHLVAAYQGLAKQSSPPIRWLNIAREELVTVYVALAEPDQAEHFRRELASAQVPPAR